MERNAGWLAGRVLVASVFIAMGSYRLLAWAGGESIGTGAIVASTAELVLGLLIAGGWQLRWTAALAAISMLVDALVSHPFWSLAGPERGAQLLHFMKNVSIIGGLVLLAFANRHRRH
ncbi:DoxX family protein [Lysobacter sp. TAF61]|uniref:DoxX family protein n=1 Tax=Lysobacter sp. TAF61 TaxID=3233072 RepID=UPI003F9E87DF